MPKALSTEGTRFTSGSTRFPIVYSSAHCCNAIPNRGYALRRPGPGPRALGPVPRAAGPGPEARARGLGPSPGALDPGPWARALDPGPRAPGPRGPGPDRVALSTKPGRPCLL